ncbi:Bpu10I family restriction endonuclease [Marinoscillum sp. 108]|uniref:Bpu10I family restriction endonuclease n=1 Tax=Marinoscillum sp. 108 TaxID=2653151 RepID=UPI0012F041E9|nr:Bpu10I family restriction endonuclease [Marinoscillum sp. 108]VXD19598.1 conserved hypothetical protein [Marinoscillum sp. 108]
MKKSEIDSEIADVYSRYLKFLEDISSFKIDSNENISKLVSSFNSYRNDTLLIIESRANSGQENIRSSMLEEFFCHLFSDLIEKSLETIPTNLFIGKANSYVDLTFSPSSFKDIFVSPNPYIHTKDQDFVLGVKLDLQITSTEKTYKESIIIPALAVECKTYIERNMLDSCAGTARRLKSAMPYCIYIVAAEYMKLKDEQPELSDINEIYILCKASNADRLKYKAEKKSPHPIDELLIIDFFDKVKGHLNSIWWSPDKALETGKVINRP